MPALSGAHALCVCACMRAPFFHCAAHPGLSNNFLVATGATEALLRNDESVLENMHAYTLFKALRRPSCNVYMNVAQDVYKEQRRSIIRCILATDLAKHFEIVGQFKSHTTSVSAGEDVPDWTLSQMILMLKVRGPAAVLHGGLGVCAPTALMGVWRRCADGGHFAPDQALARPQPVDAAVHDRVLHPGRHGETAWLAGTPRCPGCRRRFLPYPCAPPLFRCPR